MLLIIHFDKIIKLCFCQAQLQLEQQLQFKLRQYSLVLLYCQQSAAALSVAAAAATCVCRTSLYTCMYYALKYSLCLALFGSNGTGLSGRIRIYKKLDNPFRFQMDSF